LGIAFVVLTGQDNDLLAGWIQRRLTLHEAHGCGQYLIGEEFMEVRRYLPVAGAEEVAAFHFLNFARKQKRLTLKEENMLLARSRSSERQATEALVDANQILVAALSETYDDDRLSLMDRIAEGNVALMSACRRHLPGRDGSFRGHCVAKIRKAIEYALAEVESFRIVSRDRGAYPSADSGQLDIAD
jgi:DNA-directed RNA polymerase sigma subunit (sigma70/sigma32)